MKNDIVAEFTAHALPVQVGFRRADQRFSDDKGMALAVCRGIRRGDRLRGQMNAIPAPGRVRTF